MFKIFNNYGTEIGRIEVQGDDSGFISGVLGIGIVLIVIFGAFAIWPILFTECVDYNDIEQVLSLIILLLPVVISPFISFRLLSGKSVSFLGVFTESLTLGWLISTVVYVCVTGFSLGGIIADGFMALLLNILPSVITAGVVCAKQA